MSSSMETGYSYLRTIGLKTYIHLLIIALIGFTAYSNTFRVPFEFDDFDHIENNLMIRSIDNFLLALKGHDFSSSAYQYSTSRFLGYFSFALNYYFGGVDVKGYHLVNLFIHIVNAFLVYFFVVLTLRTPYVSPPFQTAQSKQHTAAGIHALNQSPFIVDHSRSFADSRLIALFSSLLFVSHPVQTQAVTYIVQRFASLATLFYLLSMVLYIKGRTAVIDNKQQPASVNPSLAKKKLNWGVSPITYRLLPIAYFVLSLVSAFLAMRTKEITYTLPLVIFLYETTFFAAPLKKKLLFLLPLVLILVIFAPVSFIHNDMLPGEIWSRVEAMTTADSNIPRWDYLMTEIRVIITYIRLIFLPINQTLDYDYPIYHSLLEPPVLISFLFLSTIFGAAVYLMYRTRRSFSCPSATKTKKSAVSSDKKGNLMGIASTRDSGFTIHDSQFIDYSLLAVQRLRLVAFGIFWFFITLSVESSIIPIKDVICEHRVYLPSVGFLIAVFAGLYTVAAKLKKVPEIALISILITLSLSVATYARNNIWKDRVSLWEDIVQNSPNLARPHTGLGAVYYNQGRLDEAMREFQTAVSLDLSNFGAHYNIGLIYWQRGLLDGAKKEFQAALWLKPDNADIHNTLGKVYAQDGFLHDAMKEYETALKFNPDHGDARKNLEALMKNAGDNNSY